MNSSTPTNINPLLTQTGTRSIFSMFILIGFILVLIGRVQEIFYFLIPLKLGLVFQILAILVIIRLIQENKAGINLGVAFEWKLLFSLWCVGIISTLFSNYKAASASFIMMSFPVLLIFFILAINIIKNTTELRIIIFSFVFTIVFLSIPSLTLTSGAGRWKSLGLTYDPNDIALLIVVTIPFCICMIKNERFINKFILVSSVLILLVALSATMSRGGFIGLVTVITVLLYRARFGFIKKLGFIIIIFFLFLFLTPESYKNRLTSIGTEEDYNLSDKFGRKAIWERNVPIVLANPILGVGPGCFTIVNGFTFGEEVGGKAWNMTAHNSYLLIAVEMGLTGVGLYAAFIIRNIIRMQQLRKKTLLDNRNIPNIWFTTALEASLFGYMVCAFFVSFTYNPVVFLLVALGVSYDNIIAGQTVNTNLCE